MVYDRGKSHSSLSYSYQNSFSRYPETEQDKKEKEQKEQERQLEQTAIASKVIMPDEVEKLILSGVTTEKEVWYEFLEAVAREYDAKVAIMVGAIVADGALPLGELVAAGIALGVAVEIYKNWNRLWEETANSLVTTHEPENQVYTTPEPEPETIEHTGSVPPKVDNSLPGFEVEKVETPNHTGNNERIEQTAQDFVMEARWSSSHRYQKNVPPVNYKNQVHHLITDAESQRSDLTQEAHDRGLWNVDRGGNLIRLPSTQAAYQQSPIKIKHHGSHPEWSRHTENILKKEEDNLKLQYGNLDKVPDNVLQQKLNGIETELRKDLSDINEGIKNGWIKIKPDGTQKLSRNEDEVSIS